MQSDFQSIVHSNFLMNSSTSSEDFRPLLNSTSIQNPTPTSYLLDLTDDSTPHLNTPHLSDFELPSTIADSDPTLSIIRVGKGPTKPALMASSSPRIGPGFSPPPTPSPCGTSLQQWSTMSPGPTTLQHVVRATTLLTSLTF